MKDGFKYGVEDLLNRYPILECCKNTINQAYFMLKECFDSGHKLLIAGNGGSCADSEHIIGELMKGFKSNRPVDHDFAKRMISIDAEMGKDLSMKLQQGFPCIALSSNQALNTAFVNDVESSGLLTFAQQLNIYGKKGDVFWAITTSGNSKNLLYASIVAKAKGIKILCLTGKDGGKMKHISDVSIIVPCNETFMIQELHLPIYHCLCLMIENGDKIN